MDVTLLGTGDTTGTPTPGCDCETCERAVERGVERSRFSVHVRNERTGESLLVDTSPDFRHQFLGHDVALPDAAVITHIHFDHLDGLGHAYRLLDHLPVHAADERDPETGESVAETVRRRYDYLDQVEVLAETPFEPFETCGFEVTLVPVDPPPLVCYGLAIEDPETGAKLSISGDTTYGIDAESRAVLADPDLLLADGIVTADLCEHHPAGGTHFDDDGVPRTFGTKHMTVEGAVALGDDLGAEETRVVHVSHFLDADRAFEAPLAVDGERYEL
ncbi:beta-lactamase [Halosimplex carlsbadense 2-9-1]|uniref:Beta-lactamase n=1 Tax=Halosimplex carlsbadense 2-9-1 TaxID=797114 RepID=M0D3V5_9EURY|nr:MBL fold metallo-hydrolase [Halosimplex carlsbadense]ELZ28844.1 beta-lactamase [Halosimplex carlsbadense 2-9-1]